MALRIIGANRSSEKEAQFRGVVDRALPKTVTPACAFTLARFARTRRSCSRPPPRDHTLRTGRGCRNPRWRDRGPFPHLPTFFFELESWSDENQGRTYSRRTDSHRAGRTESASLLGPCRPKHRR